MHSMLIYLHGFNSSSLSTKSQQLKNWCEVNRPDIRFESPNLPLFPNDVIHQLTHLIEQHRSHYRIALVGSSLGGYYATWLQQKYGFKIVIVNPAVKPYVLLQDYLGEQTHPFTGETFLLEARHMSELKALEVKTITLPKRIWLLQQQGDEVLDFRQAVEKYHDCKQKIEAEGNHAFVGFERFCHDIIRFLAL